MRLIYGGRVQYTLSDLFVVIGICAVGLGMIRGCEDEQIGSGIIEEVGAIDSMSVTVIRFRDGTVVALDGLYTPPDVGSDIRITRDSSGVTFEEFNH